MHQEKVPIEEALRQSEAKYRRLHESMTDAFVAVDMAGHIIESNLSFQSMLGYTEEDLRRLTYQDITPSSWHELEARLLAEQILPKGSSEVYQKEYRRSDGTVIPVELRTFLMRDDAGHAAGMWAIVRDISERMRLEQALEKRLMALTRPMDPSQGIQFEDLFDLEAMQRIQDEFAAATGVASIITQPDGVPLTRPSNFTRLCKNIIRGTEAGRENCYCSDALLGKLNPSGPNIQPCLSGGLWDAGASITVGDRHIANWLIGQVRDETQNEDTMRAYARTIGADETAYIEAFREVPTMSIEKFQQIARSLFSLANQLSTIAYQNIQQARFITERLLAEQALRESLQEKESLIKEIHHRVKNNLQIINSLLRLQARQIDHPVAKSALKDMQNRVRSMSLIHEHLYRAKNLAAVDLGHYLQHLCQHLFHALAVSPDAIQLDFQLAPIHLSIDQAIPCGLLVNELITNAFKHAFPEGRRGTVSVVLSSPPDEAGWSLRVSDDGIGLPRDFTIEQITSMGMRLIIDLSSQLGASVEIGPGPGAAFKVVFLKKPAMIGLACP